ncbi:MAG: alpha/beta hydrolase family protein, partial [Gemmatimonadaceae bacterium]
YWGPRGEITPRLAVALGLPSFLFSHLALVQTNANVDVPLAGAAAPHPVLLFSHGYNQGFPGQNTAQMEELASHGYVVFSIAHPHESIVVAYPDGRVVPVSRARMDSVARGMRANSGALDRFTASSDRAERSTLFRQMISEPRLLHQSLGVWTDDTRFVMDELARINAGAVKAGHGTAMFAGKLDLARTGVFGMSFGGTTAGQVCVVEPRCKAGVNLDGLQYGDPIDVPLRVPFMFMHSSLAGLNDPVYDRAAGPVYSVNVEGSTHFNYTDFSMISPIFKRIGFLGPIDATRMEAIMNAYLVAFFDTHLRGGERAQLLDGGSPIYPEVHVSARVEVSP